MTNESLKATQVVNMNYLDNNSRATVIRTTNQLNVQGKNHINITEMQNYGTSANSSKLMKFTNPISSNTNSARVHPGSPQNYNTIQY
jgi:hypothetical protein